MTTERLRGLMHAVPFRPFRIKMADGTAFSIPHPDFLAYNPAGRTCVVLTETDELHILDLLLMTELEVPRSESAAR